MTDPIETGRNSFVTVAHFVYPAVDEAEYLPLYVAGDPQGYRVVDRHRLRVDAAARASLGTYFNGFPVGEWRRRTSLDRLRLTMRFEGTGSFALRAAASNAVRIVREGSFADETVDIELSLLESEGANLLWVEIEGGESGADVVEGRWSVATPSGWEQGRATVGITTFNRPRYCLDVLGSIAASPELRGVLDRVLVVDQGDQPVAAQPEFAATVEPLGDLLSVVAQPNLGGSGGFARAMLEGSAQSAHVILLDDDVRIEPESLFRAVLLADLVDRPVIVGGGMLHLDASTVLYTQGERWDSRLSWIRPPLGRGYDHDFATSGAGPVDEVLVDQVAPDFNGWWMCLIPSEVIRRVGLPLPLFVKFDDVEFGLRAKARGIPTISVPGIAVWHMAWHNKDTPRSWEGYFVQRNRVITALLRSRVAAGGLLPVHSVLGDLRLLLKLQYSSIAIRNDAVRDVLKGPDALPAMLEHRRADVVAVRARFVDAQATDVDSAATQVRVARPGRWAAPAVLVATLARHLLMPVRIERADRLPEVSARDADWWTFRSMDAAVVRSADSGSAFRVVRSRRTAWRLLCESIGLYARLGIGWRRLVRRYEAAEPALTAREAWERRFDALRLDSNA